jgi:hypothetical protein
VPDRAALLMRCLDEGGESDRSYAALELDHVPVAERGPILVKHGEWIIAKQEEERQRIAKSKEPAAVIDRSPRETDDVLYWLEAGSEEQRLQAAKDISNVPASDCARLFEVALQDKSSRVRQAAAYNLEHAPAETLAKLVAIAIRDAERSVVDNAEHIIGAVPEESDRKELIAVINDKRRLSRLAANSELYRPDEGRYVSRDFAKTGSGTTLLDKVPGMPEASLRNRAIIRHIESGPFAEWRRIFEDAERWRAAGFDYVPIEPIVKADRQGAEVDVVTRVLRGPSVRKWRQFTSLYAPEIDNQIRMIKGVMKKIDLDHRHDHEGNFIVVFDRDSQGRPILERQPRVYMIDFDLARSRSDG